MTSRGDALSEEQIKALRRIFEAGRDVDHKQELPACIQWNEAEYLAALVKLCDMALRRAPPSSDARAVAEKAAKFCDEVASASTMESVRLALDGDASGSNFEEAKAIGARECEHAILTMLDSLPTVVNDTQQLPGDGGTTKDAARYRWLRDTFSKAVGGGIEVNDAKLVYEEPEPGRAVRLYWYPHTPVGFNESAADTLDEAVDGAMPSPSVNEREGAAPENRTASTTASKE